MPFFDPAGQVVAEGVVAMAFALDQDAGRPATALAGVRRTYATIPKPLRDEWPAAAAVRTQRTSWGSA